MSVGDDQAALFGVEAAQAAGGHDIDERGGPAFGDQLLEAAGELLVQAVADEHGAGGVGVGLHVVDDDPERLAGAADLALDVDASVVGDADAAHAQLAGDEARDAADAAVLDQIIEGGQGEDGFGPVGELIELAYDFIEGEGSIDEGIELSDDHGQLGTGGFRIDDGDIAGRVLFEEHAAREAIAYRLQYTYSENWGTYLNPLPEKGYTTSLLGEFVIAPDNKNWAGALSIAYDNSNYIGNSFGAMISVTRLFTTASRKKK